MTRTVEAVARDHLDAVREGDPTAMAADYAADAELHRGGEIRHGRGMIEAYFRTLPERLGDAVVVFDELTVEDDTATFRWHIEGGTEASGTDVMTIHDGLIVRQVVHLDSTDF
jgi:ketosteroid isomerase-like protein